MQESLAAFVKRTRESFGPWLSQAELARRAGMSSATVSRLEAGENVPEPETLEKLAAELAVPAETLLMLAGYTVVRVPSPITLEPVPPLQQIERALHAGPWKPEIRAAVWTILRETAQV